jgi:predicted nucleotidyltransferase
MQQNLTKEILEVCQILNKNEVQYLIVGGTAVAFHGYFRWSQNSSGFETEKFDLDIWYNPTYENYFKLLTALAELGQDVKDFIEEQSPNPQKSFFKFDLAKFTLDFLPKLKGHSKFKLAYEKKEVTEINGIEMSFIGIDDLLQDKAANSRPKDIEDIWHLKSIRDKK